MRMQRSEIVHADCLEYMRGMDDGVVDLVFADPPFNIGYEYDFYRDNKDHDEYCQWSSDWIQESFRILKSNGTMWIASGDAFAAEILLIAKKQGFIQRDWIIWHFTFGPNQKKKFTPSKTHLFYLVKDANQFTFNFDAVAIPSARQLKFKDKRANGAGKVPDNVWLGVEHDGFLLCPEEAYPSATMEGDVWLASRVAGTVHERLGWHPCQMPTKVLERILLSTSNPGEFVFDPFSGSATTVAVAKAWGREAVATEISEDYARKGQERVDAIVFGERLAEGTPILKSSY